MPKTSPALWPVRSHAEFLTTSREALLPEHIRSQNVFDLSWYTRAILLGLESARGAPLQAVAACCQDGERTLQMQDSDAAGAGLTANYNGTVEQSDNVALTPYQLIVNGGIPGSGTDNNTAFQVTFPAPI